VTFAVVALKENPQQANFAQRKTRVARTAAPRMQKQTRSRGCSADTSYGDTSCGKPVLENI